MCIFMFKIKKLKKIEKCSINYICSFKVGEKMLKTIEKDNTYEFKNLLLNNIN